MYSLTIEDSNGQIAEQFSFDHGSYLIGRQENCDIVLPSSSVSRRHANLFVKDGRCYIEDLNSANGVTVDGQRVVKQRHLGTASQVRIGNYYLYLEFQASEGAEDQNVRETLFISDSPDHNKLVRINDEFAGEEFSLSEVENTIGRTDDNFILLSDPSISREHAVITHEGEGYRLVELGSSNGTRVNGEEVIDSVDLSPGDLVEFGSVEFVFARGDQQVDPSQYKSQKSSSNKLLLASVVTVVLLVGVIAGGLIVFGFWSLKEGSTSAKSAETGSVSSQIAPLIEEGETNLQEQNWDKAIDAFNEVLALNPEHAQAKKLREKAREEKKAMSLYDKGIELSGAGEHREAMEMLEEIPEGTAAHQRAQSSLEHIRSTIAFNLRSEAEKLVDSGGEQELKDAHEKLVRAVSLASDNAKTREMLSDLESRLDSEGIDYEKADLE